MAGIHWNEAHDTVWFTQEEEATTHYHVVAFMDGCLNDYDSGPYSTIEDAEQDLAWYLESGAMVPDAPIEDAGYLRYANGPYIIKVEECTEECDGKRYNAY